jgi:hypothetical protein
VAHIVFSTLQLSQISSSSPYSQSPSAIVSPADNASHPLNAAGKITVLYVFILIFVVRKTGKEKLCTK